MIRSIGDPPKQGKHIVSLKLTIYSWWKIFGWLLSILAEWKWLGVSWNSSLQDRYRQVYRKVTRPIPVRSCEARVRDCRVKELDIFCLLIIILFYLVFLSFFYFYFILFYLISFHFYFTLFYFILFYFILFNLLQFNSIWY